MLLRLSHTDNGNCRVYYKDNKKLLCFQENRILINGAYRTIFELHRCSKDGEPANIINCSGVTINKLPQGVEATDKNFRLWYPVRKDIHAPSYPELLMR